MRRRRLYLLCLVFGAVCSTSVALAQVNENLLKSKRQEVQRDRVEKEITSAARETAAFDIVGLRLGITMDEAEKIVRAHMQVGRVFELSRVPPLLPTDAVPAYASGKLFIREDGRETIGLINEPPAASDRVVAVTRGLTAPAGQMPAALVLSSLRNKYGAETHLQRFSDNSYGAYWIGKLTLEAATPTLSTCYLANYAHNTEGKFWELPWMEGKFDQPFNRNKEGAWVPSEAQKRGAAFVWPLTPKFLAADAPRAANKRCFAGIGAQYVQINGLDQLQSFLVDHDRYHADLIASRKILRSSAGKPAVPTGPSASDIKL